MERAAVSLWQAGLPPNQVLPSIHSPRATSSAVQSSGSFAGALDLHNISQIFYLGNPRNLGANRGFYQLWGLHFPKYVQWNHNHGIL